MMRPVEKPEKYYIIERTGGSETNHLRTATIAIQSYAPTLAEACELNEEVIELTKEMVELESISSVRYSTDYNFTNQTKKQPRYQAVFSILYY